MSRPYVLNIAEDVIQNTGGCMPTGAATIDQVGQPFPHILHSNGTIQFFGIDSNWNWSPTHRGLRNDNYTPAHCWRDITGISNAVAISTSVGHGCAILEGGGVKCWGNRCGLGIGCPASSVSSRDYSDPPTDVPGLSEGVTQIAAGTLSTCALKGSEVWCWGAGTKGQLGNGQLNDSPVAVKVNPWAE